MTPSPHLLWFRLQWHMSSELRLLTCRSQPLDEKSHHSSMSHHLFCKKLFFPCNTSPRRQRPAPRISLITLLNYLFPSFIMKAPINPSSKPSFILNQGHFMFLCAGSQKILTAEMRLCTFDLDNDCSWPGNNVNGFKIEPFLNGFLRNDSRSTHMCYK